MTDRPELPQALIQVHVQDKTIPSLQIVAPDGGVARAVLTPAAARHIARCLMKAADISERNGDA